MPNSSGPVQLVKVEESTSPMREFESTVASTFTDEVGFYGCAAGEQVIVVVLIMLSAYLALVTVLYLYKHPHPALKLSNCLLCVTTCMLFLQCWWFQVEITVKNYTDSFCTAYLVVNVVAATIMRTIVYIVLWLRQRGIYNNPLQRLDGAKVKIISKITLAGILSFAVFQIAILSSVPQSAKTNGCISGIFTGVLEILTPIVFSISSIFQIVLFGLTLYPVIKHVSGKTLSQRKGKIAAVAIRLSVCTAVCVLDDTIFVVVTMTKPDDAPVSFIPLCYAFNTIINIMATLFSFVNYSIRLWPLREPTESKASIPPTATSSSMSRNVI